MHSNVNKMSKCVLILNITVLKNIFYLKSFYKRHTNFNDFSIRSSSVYVKKSLDLSQSRSIAYFFYGETFV